MIDAAREAMMDGYRIELMDETHLDSVAQIEATLNTRPWSRSLFAHELPDPHAFNVVCVNEDNVVCGYAALMFLNGDAHVTNIGVAAEHRRNAIATAMMNSLVGHAQSVGIHDMTLEVRIGNKAAIELYRQFGFSPGGIRPGYYQDNAEDALIMWAHDVKIREVSNA